MLSDGFSFPALQLSCCTGSPVHLGNWPFAVLRIPGPFSSQILPVNSLTLGSHGLSCPTTSEIILTSCVDFCPREQRMKAWNPRTAGLPSYFFLIWFVTSRQETMPVFSLGSGSESSGTSPILLSPWWRPPLLSPL